MKVRAVVGLILSLLAAGASARAQTATLSGETLEDVQCFALFAMIAGQTGVDGEAVAAGEVEATPLLVAMTGGMMYHLGRLRGRAPDVDWLSRISDYVWSVEAADLEPARTRCAKTMSDNGEALVAWGTRLQKE